jgi:hypothetical protein
MRGGKKVLALMRRLSQRVGTIHLRFTSMRVMSTGRSRAIAAITPLGQMIVTGSRIGEKNDFQGLCHSRSCGARARSRVIAHPCGGFQSLVSMPAWQSAPGPAQSARS